MLYLQKHLTNLQKHFFGWKMRKVAIVVENFNCAQKFWFCNSNVTTFPISRKCKNFNFSLYTVPAEMLYLQKYLTNFQKLSLAERWGTWLLWLKISIAQTFWFCNSNVTTFPISRKCKNFNFSLYTVPAEMLYLQKYLTNFKNFFWLKDEEAWLLWLKIFNVHRNFSFAIATLQLFQYPENVKISIFPFTLSPEKCYIFKSIWRIFKNILLLKDEERGYCGWKFQCAQIFWFCNSNVTTFPISRKCKNFNFSLYIVPAEMLYLQKYLTNFQKLFLAERWGRWLLSLKISSAQIFWFCNSNVTTFPTSRKCKNFNFSLYTVPAEMLYLQKYLTNFQKHYFGWKMRNGGYCGWKFESAQTFWFCNSNVTTFPTIQKM